MRTRAPRHQAPCMPSRGARFSGTAQASLGPGSTGQSPPGHHRAPADTLHSSAWRCPNTPVPGVLTLPSRIPHFPPLMSGHSMNETLLSRPLVAKGLDGCELSGRRDGRRGGRREGWCMANDPLCGCLRHRDTPFPADGRTGISLTLSSGFHLHRDLPRDRRATGNIPAAGRPSTGRPSTQGKLCDPALLVR